MRNRSASLSINRNYSSMNGVNNKCNRKNICICILYMYIELSKLVFVVN